MTSAPLHILGISGSLRKGSYNSAALRAASELLPDGVSLEIFDLSAIPLYNGDVEAQGFPQAVLDFRERITAADALLIATPEYNASIPAVLKNALDWASRPTGSAGSPLDGKPVAILGASPSFLGTSRAQYHLRQVFVNVNMFPVQKPEVFLTLAHTKFDEAGKLTDEPSRTNIRQLLESLATWTRRFQTSV